MNGSNVSGGSRPRDKRVDDEDKDGVKDADEGTASVTSYGSAAAFQIGAADKAITVGAVSGNAQGHGLVINGSVSGQGVYKSVDGNGLVIGGLGRAVTIAGGMTVNGKIEASSFDKNATALRIGNRDCQDFRVWPGIMGNKESHYVTTQRTCHTE